MTIEERMARQARIVAERRKASLAVAAATAAPANDGGVSIAERIAEQRRKMGERCGNRGYSEDASIQMDAFMREYNAFIAFMKAQESAESVITVPATEVPLANGITVGEGDSVVLKTVVTTAAAEPVAVDPVAAEPVAVDPVAAEPDAADSVAAEPVATEPVAEADA